MLFSVYSLRAQTFHNHDSQSLDINSNMKLNFYYVYLIGINFGLKVRNTHRVEFRCFFLKSFSKLLNKIE